MKNNTFWLDLKFVIRQLRRYPGFAALSISALAVGIGLVTAMFTIVDGTIIDGPDFPNGRDLKVIKWETPRDGMHPFVRIQDFNDLREQQESFRDLGFWTYHGASIRAEDSTKSWAAALVSANFLDILGERPALGRGFYQGEDRPGAEKTVILGHRVWQEQFGGDDGVIGRTVGINGNAYTVVGVMPEGFRFPVAHDVWMPYQEDRYEDPRRDAELVWVFGHLKDGVSLEAAQAGLDRIAGRLAEAYPESNEHYLHFQVIPFIKEFMDQSEEILWAMLGAVVLVLFIACSNVANLILAKSVARTQELAIRRSLGASRGRIVAQILNETAVITLLGGLLGVLLSLYILDWFGGALGESNLPYWFDLSLSVKTVGLLAVLVAGTALLAGIFPAWAASRLEINHLLSDQTRSSSGMKVGRFNKGLIVMQIALSLGALVGAFGMMRATLLITNQQFVFDPEAILQTQISISEEQMADDREVAAFFRELDRRLEAQPGVDFVAQTSSHALVFPWTSRMRVEGESYAGPEDYEVVQQEIVSWDYFRSLEIPILEGRDFLESDGENMAASEAEAEEWIGVVNQAMADKFWPGESALGRRVKDTWRQDSPWVRIVGVVPNRLFDVMGAGPGMPHLFRVSNQSPLRDATVFLKLRGEPTAFIPTLERVVREVNPEIVAREPMTVAQRIDLNMRGLKVITQVFASSGVIALFLGSIGIYGVISFAALQRTREFGIRLALGASPRSILRLVLRSGAWQLAIGIPLGLVIGWVILKGMAANIENIDFANPLVFTLPAVAIVGVALLAGALPARRAARINPTEAIRDL